MAYVAAYNKVRTGNALWAGTWLEIIERLRGLLVVSASKNERPERFEHYQQALSFLALHAPPD